jgi:CDP-diacylglycerol--glycerol-3-phosphate 3-phosphatidyltransferase
MKLKQQIPNALSILRIFQSLSIFIVRSNTVLTFVVILFCGLTDILDGYIAKKVQITKHFGRSIRFTW